MGLQSKGTVEFGSNVQVDFQQSANCVIVPDNLLDPSAWCQHTQAIQHQPLGVPQSQGVSLDANVSIEHGLKPIISASFINLASASISAIVYLRAEIDFQYPAYPPLTGNYDPSYGTSLFHFGGCDQSHYIQYAVVGGINSVSAQYGYNIPVPTLFAVFTGISIFSSSTQVPLSDTLDVPIVSGCLFNTVYVQQSVTYTIPLIGNFSSDINVLAYNLAYDLSKACDVPQYRIHLVPSSTTVNNAKYHLLQSTTNQATVSVLPSSDNSGPSVSDLSLAVSNQLTKYNSQFYQLTSNYVIPVAPPTPAPTPASTPAPTPATTTTSNGNNVDTINSANNNSGGSSSITAGMMLYVIIGASAAAGIIMIIVVIWYIRRQQQPKTKQAGEPQWIAMSQLQPQSNYPVLQQQLTTQPPTLQLNTAEIQSPRHNGSTPMVESLPQAVWQGNSVSPPTAVTDETTKPSSYSTLNRRTSRRFSTDINASYAV